MLDRDLSIVLSIADFKQLSTAALGSMHFHGLSETPKYRVLDRLVASNVLAVTRRRDIGGTGAGSGPNIYQLGRVGWAVAVTHGKREGAYWKLRSIDDHTLTIGDAYLQLLALEREGKLEIVRYETEPSSHRSFNGRIVRPDFYAVVKHPYSERQHPVWLEIDRGTERVPQIKKKLEDYVYAINHWNGDGDFPYVIFLAPDPDRVKYIRAIIAEEDEADQDMFLVSTVPEYARLLFG
jgi:hypothetical protein